MIHILALKADNIAQGDIRRLSPKEIEAIEVILWPFEIFEKS